MLAVAGAEALARDEDERKTDERDEEQ